MRKWNPIEMKAMFREKARINGCSLRDFLKKFVEEMTVPISYNTLERYFLDGSKGPVKYEVRQSLYEKIEKDFGYRMFGESDGEVDSKEMFIEDREKKLPEFCQRKLEEAFANILQYLIEAYDGQYTLLFESDYAKLLYYFAIYKPCAPNYLCCEIKEFFKEKLSGIKEEAVNSGLIIYEGVGFGYVEDLEEGEDADIDDCELAEDYIENNIEEHRERVRKLIYEVADFWSKKVERLYQDGTGQASDICERFDAFLSY